MRALRVFDERGGIKVAYEFWVVGGFDTKVGECCWRRRGVGKSVYFRKNRMVVRGYSWILLLLLLLLLFITRYLELSCFSHTRMNLKR